MPGFAGEVEDVITGSGFLFTAGARRPEIVMSGVCLPVVPRERLPPPDLLRRAVCRAPASQTAHTAHPGHSSTRGPGQHPLPGRGKTGDRGGGGGEGGGEGGGVVVPGPGVG